MIYVDFHNTNAKGEVRLNTRGTLDSLNRLGVRLHVGAEIDVGDDELVSRGVVAFDDDESMWVVRLNAPPAPSVPCSASDSPHSAPGESKAE